MRYYGFLSFLGTFAHNVAQTWFVLHETWQTTLFNVYYCVEVVRIENNNHMLNITCQVAILWVFKFFFTLVHKVDQTWFFLHEIRHTTLFGIYYCVVLVRIEELVIC